MPQHVISRRCLFGIAWGAGYGVRSVQAGKSDVWNAKPAAEWSDEDIQKILTKSPWVKETAVSLDMSGRGGGGGMGGGGMGGRGGGGGGMGGRGGGGMGGGGMGGGGMGGGGMEGGGMGGGGGAPSFKATVRWESAQPIRDALKKPLPPEWASNYIITVSGLPMGGGRPGQRPGANQFQAGAGGQQPGGNPEQRRQAMVARLKEDSTLTVKGKDPVGAARVDMTPSQQRPIIVIAFSRATLPIALDDKEVVFATRVGPFRVKTKFTLKDMLYQGKLAI